MMQRSHKLIWVTAIPATGEDSNSLPVTWSRNTSEIDPSRVLLVPEKEAQTPLVMIVCFHQEVRRHQKE